MGIEWFLIPTLAGYWFLTHLNVTRYRILRDSGYHVFFQSAFFGSIIVVFARFIAIGLSISFARHVELWEYYAPFPYSGTAILSVVLSLIIPPVVNLFFTTEDAARRIAEKSGDLIELLLAESIQRQELILVSTRSGKSYIGFVQQSGIYGQGDSDVSLVPMASGYREKGNHELIITTYYVDLIEEYLESSKKDDDLSFSDFQVVIPVSEIISARIFDFEIFEKFQNL